jgi:hypothetical protein
MRNLHSSSHRGHGGHSGHDSHTNSINKISYSRISYYKLNNKNFYINAIIISSLFNNIRNPLIFTDNFIYSNYKNIICVLNNNTDLHKFSFEKLQNNISYIENLNNSQTNEIISNIHCSTILNKYNNEDLDSFMWVVLFAFILFIPWICHACFCSNRKYYL